MAEAHGNARRPPRLDWTGLEWKLALATVLAGAYAMLWLSLQSPATAATEAVDELAPSVASVPEERVGVARWLQELPPSAREALAPPPGYRFATVEPASTASTAAAASPTTRPRRVRTRSS